MEKLEKKIIEMVEEEAEIDKELPTLHSPHEGWAFLFEEQVELSTDFGALCGKVSILLEKIRLGNLLHEIKYEAGTVKNFALSVATDAVRVAVAAQKLLDFLEKGEGREDERL